MAQKFLTDLSVMRIEQPPIMLFCDNNRAVEQSKELRNYRKGKHIKHKYHLIRDIVSSHLVDPFTKTLSHKIFKSHLEDQKAISLKLFC